MLATYFSSLRKLFDLALLFLCNESTLFAIVSESALLQFIYSSSFIYLLDSFCLDCIAFFKNLLFMRCDYLFDLNSYILVTLI